VIPPQFPMPERPLTPGHGAPMYAPSGPPVIPPYPSGPTSEGYFIPPRPPTGVEPPVIPDHQYPRPGDYPRPGEYMDRPTPMVRPADGQDFPPFIPPRPSPSDQMVPVPPPHGEGPFIVHPPSGLADTHRIERSDDSRTPSSSRTPSPQRAPSIHVHVPSQAPHTEGDAGRVPELHRVSEQAGIPAGAPHMVHSPPRTEVPGQPIGYPGQPTGMPGQQPVVILPPSQQPSGMPPLGPSYYSPHMHPVPEPERRPELVVVNPSEVSPSRRSRSHSPTRVVVLPSRGRRSPSPRSRMSRTDSRRSRRHYRSPSYDRDYERHPPTQIHISHPDRSPTQGPIVLAPSGPPHIPYTHSPSRRSYRSRSPSYSPERPPIVVQPGAPPYAPSQPPPQTILVPDPSQGYPMQPPVVVAAPPPGAPSVGMPIPPPETGYPISHYPPPSGYPTHVPSAAPTPAPAPVIIHTTE
jgi:hypothetical protein